MLGNSFVINCVCTWTIWGVKFVLIEIYYCMLINYQNNEIWTNCENLSIVWQDFPINQSSKVKGQIQSQFWVYYCLKLRT